MLEIKPFTFNAFQENTYVLSDKDSKHCIIIDPGCSNTSEQAELVGYIEENGLIPKRLINTHCHIDHVLGNKFVSEKYGLPLEAHELEVETLQSGEMVSKMYGIPYQSSPKISTYLNEGDDLTFCEHEIKIFLTPGHSPGSICLYLPAQGDLIAGDVLFQGSIGRTDLPGGSYETLIGSILAKIMPLPDETVVYPGHGPSTTVGRERMSNPFLN